MIEKFLKNQDKNLIIDEEEILRRKPEEREYPEQNLENGHVVRILPFQLILPEEIPDDADPRDIEFSKSIWAFKTGKQNFGQVMPAGGNIEPGEYEKDALAREFMEETALKINEHFTKPIKMGGYSYQFPYKGENLKINNVSFYTLSIPPYAYPHVLNLLEDKMFYIKLNLTETENLLTRGKIKFIPRNHLYDSQYYPEALSGREPDDLYIVDHMNPDTEQREKNKVIAEEDSIMINGLLLLHQMEDLESLYKQKIIKKISLIDKKIPADQKESISQIDFSRFTFSRMKNYYKDFIRTYGIDTATVKYALDLINLEMETAPEIMGRSTLESTLRIPFILSRIQSFTRDRIHVLLKNPLIRSTFKKFMAFGRRIPVPEEEIPGQKTLTPEEKLKYLSSVSDPRILAPLIKEIFSIDVNDEENISMLMDIANKISRQITSLNTNNTAENDNQGFNINAQDLGVDTLVAQTNNWWELLLLILRGPILSQNDPKEFKRIQFEARIKGIFTLLARPLKEHFHNMVKNSDLIEKNLFHKLYDGGVIEQKTYPVYSLAEIIDKNGQKKTEKRLIDVSLENPQSLFVSTADITYLYDTNPPQRFRHLNINGKKVLTFIEERAPKSPEKMGRKAVIRGFDNVREIMDVNGRYVVLNEPSERINRELTFYRRDEQGGFIQTTEQVEDHQLVFDFMEELIWSDIEAEIKIINYKPTPAGDAKIKSKGPGGNGSVRYAKFDLYYKKEEKETWQELIIFTPSQNKSALYYLVQKKWDDKFYHLARRIIPANKANRSAHDQIAPAGRDLYPPPIATYSQVIPIIQKRAKKSR